MFNLFKNKKDSSDGLIYAPLTGKVVELEQVPDPTFAEKMMGDGIAIDPTDGEVVSPVDGKVIQIFPTKHAIGIQAKSGAEILIHIGLDTVTMNGEGFTPHIKQGDKVEVGQKLMSVDLEKVRTQAASTITPVIVTNGSDLSAFTKEDATEAKAGETVLINYQP